MTMRDTLIITFEKYDELMAKKGGGSVRETDDRRQFEEFFTREHEAIVRYDPASDTFRVGKSQLGGGLHYKELAVYPQYLEWSVDQHAALVGKAHELRSAYLSSKVGQAQKILEGLGVSMSLAHKLMCSRQVKVSVENEYVGWGDK